MRDIDVVAATDEEKHSIAKHFLLSSPPGQFTEVLEDIRKLLPDHFLSDDVIGDIAKAFSAMHGQIVLEGERKVLVSKIGGLDGNHMIDPSSKRVIGVDHLHGRVLPGGSREVRGGEMDESIEQERGEVERAVTEYVATQYVTETAASSVNALQGSLHIVLYGERLNLRNFWSGSWLSVWEVNLGEVPSIRGSIKIRAHYFEEGNVQMQTTKDYPATPLSTSEPLGVASIQAIKGYEQQLQQGLEAMYANMGDETFKAMRRKLTISKNRMEWNVHAHRVTRMMGK